MNNYQSAKKFLEENSSLALQSKVVLLKLLELENDNKSVSSFENYFDSLVVDEDMML